MTSSGRWAAILSLGLHAASAQQPGPLADPGGKTVRIVRTATPPVIDGRLDDGEWVNAALVDDLHQVTPIEYAEPYERTEIYLLYDDDALYIGARLYDTNPDQITAQNLRQNDSIGQDDRFYVTLDPFNNRRSGYFFGVNPNGVRQDGLYQNVTEFYGAWDSIYYAEAGQFEEGWTAEMAIPFKSLSFDPGTDAWGLNFSRGVARKNENIAWVSRNRQYNPSASGLAVGFEGLQQGIGLDIVPSVSIGRARTFSPDGSDSEVEPSLDLVYKLTPQLNGSLTFNTDFSATEVDDRQVNLTRFGLFFPEKRDFFLREADIFEFGGIGASRQSQIPGLNPLRQNGRPFFSRRIGLSSAGDVVDLNYGAKISGRVGDWELGALSIRQDEFGAVGADTLSVVRAKLSVLNESSVGMIATEGNPGANLDNSVAGLDFLYRNTRLPGGRTLEAQAWYQRSDTEGLEGNDAAAGLAVQIPSAAGMRGAAEIKEFQTNFNPALGFINRRGVRDTSASVGYMHRPADGFLQSLLVNVTAQRIEEIDGGLQTEALFFQPFELTNQTGDTLMIGYRSQTEVLSVPFGISSGIFVPPGRYEFDDWGIQLGTGNHRKIAGNMRYVRYQDGDFFGGDRSDYYAAVTWRPSARFRTNLGYELSEIRLPQGDFETRLVQSGFDVIFSSTLSWVNLVQYDNVSETIGINMRLHWIPQAGREMYFVINHNMQDFDRDNSFQSITSDVTAKLNYTFRF
jgi:hypothetical protein